MKIIETSIIEDDYEKWTLVLTTENFTKKISFGRGEREDNCLGRDLADVFSISDMLKAAYQAGKNNEQLIVESKENE